MNYKDLNFLKKCVLLFSFSLFQDISSAQDFVEKLVEQPVGVFHLDNRAGRTREVVQVKLPLNTVRWVYTFSAYRDQASVNKVKSVFNLISELSKFSVDQTGVTAFVLNKLSDPPGTNYADVFLLNSASDVTKFENKKNDFERLREGSRENCVSAKFIIDNPSFQKGYQYLGFRNNEMLYGVNIQVQIVAVIRESKPLTEWRAETKNTFFKVFSSFFYSSGLGKYLSRSNIDNLVSCVMDKLVQDETPESLKSYAGYELFRMIEKYGG